MGTLEALMIGEQAVLQCRYLRLARQQAGAVDAMPAARHRRGRRRCSAHIRG